MPTKKAKAQGKPKRGRPSQGLTGNVNVRLNQGQPERIEKLAQAAGVDASVIHRTALELGLLDLEGSNLLPFLSKMGVKIV